MTEKILNNASKAPKRRIIVDVLILIFKVTSRFCIWYKSCDNKKKLFSCFHMVKLVSNQLRSDDIQSKHSKWNLLT